MTTSGYTGTESATGGPNGAADKAKQAASEGREVGQHAAESGKEVAGTAMENAQNVASQARQQGVQLKQEATAQIHTVAQETTSQLREHASTQTERAAQQLRTFSDQARAFSEGRTDEAGQLPQLAQQATETLANIADRLETHGIDGVMHDAKRFARRRPGAFLLMATAAGFGIGRVVRGAKVAKDENQNQGEQYYESDYDYQYTAPRTAPTPQGRLGAIDLDEEPLTTSTPDPLRARQGQY